MAFDPELPNETLPPATPAPTAKELADKELVVQERGAKVLGDMEVGIRDKLVSVRDDLGAEFTKLHAAYNDMPDDVKGHPLYKPLGAKISSIDAVLTNLKTTAALFPVPAEPSVPHGSL